MTAGRAALVEYDITQPLPAYPGKSCGDCGLCCEIVPVKELRLTGWQRCPHLKGLPEMGCGCRIYEDRPISCRLWSCTWLISDTTDELRPDRLGVVIDPLPDIVRVQGVEKPAAQFWVARDHEDDWQKPAVQALIVATVEAGFIVLWRMAPDAEDRRLAICFAYGDNGRIGRSQPFEATAEDMGDAGERLVRAQHLVREAGR